MSLDAWTLSARGNSEDFKDLPCQIVMISCRTLARRGGGVYFKICARV